MISQDPEAPSSSETGWMRERTTTKATGCCWVLTGRVRSPVGSVHSAVYHSSPRAIMAVWTFAGRIWMAQEMPTCSVSVCQSSELQDGSAEPNHAYPPAPGLLHACFAPDRQQSTQPSRHRRRRRAAAAEFRVSDHCVQVVRWTRVYADRTHTTLNLYPKKYFIVVSQNLKIFYNHIFTLNLYLILTTTYFKIYFTSSLSISNCLPWSHLGWDATDARKEEDVFRVFPQVSIQINLKFVLYLYK